MAKNEGNKVWNSTLRRKSPLKSKAYTLKRSQFHRSKPPKDKAFYGHAARSTLKPGKGLKAVSKKHRRALTKRYYPAQAEFLSYPENRFCWICLGRSLNATRAEIRGIMLRPHHEATGILMGSGAKCTPATEVHHYAGRVGRLLDFTPYFIPECRGCREWPHTNARAARDLDLLASATAYNVFPREREAELWEEYENNSSFQSKKDVDP